MGWVANPLNLLIVDSTHRQPDFIGWYSLNNLLLPESNLAPSPLQKIGGHTTLLLPSNGSKIDKGLTPGLSTTNTLRNGNRNDSITLSADQAIVSHAPSGDGTTYTTYIPVTVGQAYTLGVTAIGINPSRNVSTLALKILWVNAAGHIINDDQGIIAEFGQKIRNSVTSVAPLGTVGAVIMFAADHAVVLTLPTFAAGTTDVRDGNPIFTPTPTPSDNLFFYDPENSSIPWQDGWTNEFGQTLSLVTNALPILANTEARLYFEEDQQTPTTMGIRVLPLTQYTFSLTEVGSRTDSVITLKIYDNTGIQVLSTVTPVTNGNKVEATFTTPAGSEYVAIKIVGGSVNTSFSTPAMFQGATIPDPGNGLLKVNVNWVFISDLRAIVPIRMVLLSGNSSKVSNSWQLLSDTVIKATLNSYAFVSDNHAKVALTEVFVSDNLSKIAKSITLLTDSLETLHWTKTFVSDNTQKVGTRTWQLITDSNAKVNKAIVFNTDSLQIVGRQFPVGGVVTAEDLLSGITLLPGEPLYRPSRSLVLLSGGTAKVNIAWTFITDSRQQVGTKTVRFDTDSFDQVSLRPVFISDNLFTIHKTIQFVTNIPENVSVSILWELKTDSNRIVHKKLNIVSGRYPRHPRHVVTTRPTHKIGVV